MTFDFRPCNIENGMAKLMVKAALHRLYQTPAGGGHGGKFWGTEPSAVAFWCPERINHQISGMPIERSHPTRVW